MEGNVLVTGGSGFIGSYIANALTGKKCCEVTVYDIRAPNKAKNRNISLVRGDIFDLDGLTKILREREITHIIHMVGLASIPDCRKDPNLSFRLNLSSVHFVLEAMRLCDVKRLIFPSTAAVYGATNGPKLNENTSPKPASVYGCHKLGAEMLLRAYMENYGLDATILRIFNVYGDLKAEQGFTSLSIRNAIAGKPIIVSGGEQLRDFVFLNDVVKAFVKSLSITDMSQRIINVGSGVGVPIREIAEMIRQSFPSVEIHYEPSNVGEYSIYADVSNLKSVLGIDPLDPRVGIPKFVKECKLKRGSAKAQSVRG